MFKYMLLLNDKYAKRKYVCLITAPHFLSGLLE